MRPRTLVHAPLQTALALLAVVLAGATAIVVVMVHEGPLGSVPVAYGFPAVGGLYAAAGLLAWSRRPANRLGVLLVLGGALWLTASLANTAPVGLIAAGTVTAVLPISVVLHLLLASPGGVLPDRASRVTAAAGYVTGGLLQAPLWAFTPQPAPYDVVLVSPRPDLARAGHHLQQAVGACVVAAVVVLLVRRLRRYERPQRRVLAPLFLDGVVAVLASTLVANVLTPLLHLQPETRAALQLVAVATVPLGFLLVVLRGGFARTGELSALVTSVASSSGSRSALEDAVVRTLGDPSAALLHWSDARGAHLSPDGDVVPLPEADGRRDVVHVTAGEQRLGALVYDPRLVTDPESLTAVAEVAAVAMERERLTAEVSRSRQALRDASARLLGDSDRERRRLARDLHDGLQVSLVRLSMQAHRLAAEAQDPDRAALAARLAADVDEAAAALRALVDGVMPAPLVERGLAAAVQELAYGLPVRTRLDVAGVEERLPAPVESTAYFIVAEALTNVVKHARATTVELALRRDGEQLCIEVVDDGVGGAHASSATGGTGLTGLRDRVDVLGGTLVVDSGPGGTRLRAELPCEQAVRA